jgi:LPPG:FO 2-phospho-L-lactate transferase
MFLCLAGGVGGAKLAHGFAGMSDVDTAVVVNTGDDFEHFGLYIAPDIDTVTYTLANINNSETGWGIRGESWNFMSAVARLGGPSWFFLGDQDLATHLTRTLRLAAGETLSAVTRDLAARLGVRTRIVPMSDERVRTVVVTNEGPLAFQDYFVRAQCKPAIRSLRFDGASSARRAPEFESILSDPTLEAIVVCPSNPYISIDPILSVQDTLERLRRRKVPLVAVSPIVGQKALKGPAAKMMSELGIQPSAKAVAEHYGALLDGFVIDQQDADEANGIRDMGLEVLVAATVMQSGDDQLRLAGEVARFAVSCGRAMASRADYFRLSRGQSHS